MGSRRPSNRTTTWWKTLGSGRQAALIGTIIVALSGCVTATITGGFGWLSANKTAAAPSHNSNTPVVDHATRGSSDRQNADLNCVHPQFTANAGPGVVTITSPQRGDTVLASGFFVQGVQTAVAADSDVWILAYHAPSGRFWIQGPKSSPVSQSPNGTFATTARFGTTGAWQIIAVTADPSSSRFLSDEKAKWDTAGAWPGLTPDELPRGLAEKTCIPLIAK